MKIDHRVPSAGIIRFRFKGFNLSPSAMYAGNLDTPCDV